MKDRINHFLTSERISPAEFADKIGVQRSSVSHVLNGRNYPSATFIQKMLEQYKQINPRWLLLGEGSMYEKSPQPSSPGLFDSIPETKPSAPSSGRQLSLDNVPASPQDSTSGDSALSTPSQSTVTPPEPAATSGIPIPIHDPIPPASGVTLPPSPPTISNSATVNELQGSPLLNAALASSQGDKIVERIVLFYSDKTFTAYTPSN